MSDARTSPGTRRHHARRPRLAPASHATAIRMLILALAMAAAALAAPSGALAQDDSVQGRGDVIVADVDGVIDQVMARFISRILDQARENEAALVILRIDTPGGLLDATRDIVADILASPVPVVSFVAPPGARAASAGTFVSAAAGVAAMAPATNIGAASPVGGGGEDLGKTLERKVKEDAAALIRSLAASRGRNSKALERTVFEATAFSAEEAVENNVVDLLATDIDDLLNQLDGRAIPTTDGREVTFTGPARSVHQAGESFMERALSFLSTPDVAFLLLSLGGLAIIVELWSPGLTGPGVVGLIMLLLAFAGLGSLPFSWVGVALIGLALVFFFVEAHIPGFGLFGIAGAVSLVIGGVMLVGFFGAPGLPGTPPVRVSVWMLAGVGGGAGLIVLWFAREIRLSRRLPAYVSPVDARALTGESATVTVRLDPEGEVRVAGETWIARLASGDAADVGAEVVVQRVDGLTLEVASPEPAAEGSAERSASATPEDESQSLG